MNEADRVKERKFLIIAAGILAMILIITLAIIFLGNDKQQPAEAVEEDALNSQFADAMMLPPIFLEAEACFSRCAGEDLNFAQRDRFKLPYQFVDLLKKEQFQSNFQRLIGSFPAEYSGLAHLIATDRDGLKLEGTANAMMTTSTGREIQIYYNVGYPENRWRDPDETGELADTDDSELLDETKEFRRPVGILHVAVDITNGEMAGIFNGPENLSDYRFGGSEGLLPPLLAYLVANNFHMAKLRKLGFPDDAPRLTFPLAEGDLAAASDRLRYLAEHFENGQIVGTQTLDDLQEAEDDAAGRSWYSPNSSWTSCLKMGGPAEKLDEFVGFTDQPTTKDFHDESGNLIKVEVENDQGDGTIVTWTFYKHRADCERDWVTRNENLADQYR